MAESALVESQISDSIALIKLLDEQDVRVSCAFWHYFTDADEWRLMLAGPSFDELLPQEEARAYQTLAEALTASHATSLTIGEVKLARTDHRLVKAVRMTIGTPEDDLVRAYFSETTVNGIFVKEMVVLRSSLSASAKTRRHT